MMARLLVCPLDTTRTSTGPTASSDGVSALTFSGLTYSTYAAFPLTVTLTLSSDAGNCPAASSSSVQVRVVVARFLPAIVIQVLGAMVAWLSELMVGVETTAAGARLRLVV